jgi:NADH-quinone oxidoreductase subunit K
MIVHLLVPFFLFLLGICGVFLSRKNVIITIMCLEVMLLSINLNLIFCCSYIDDLIGQMFSIFILSIGASETAIGLALVVAYYKGYRYN